MRGIASVMNRSRNSHIRAPRSVTTAPIGMPLPQPEVRDRLLRAGSRPAFWPVIAPSSSTTASSSFGFLIASPTPHVEHDLLEPRHLVRVGEPELLGQLGPHRVLVELPAAAGAPSRALGSWSTRSGRRPSPCPCSPAGLGRALGGLRRLGRLLLRVRHRHRLLGIGWSVFTAIRSFVPSASIAAAHPRRLTALRIEQHHVRVMDRRLALDDARPRRSGVGARCRFTMLTPSIDDAARLGDRPGAPCPPCPCRRPRSPGPCHPW